MHLIDDSNSFYLFCVIFSERRKLERQEQGAARRRDWQERYAQSRSQRSGTPAPLPPSHTNEPPSPAKRSNARASASTSSSNILQRSNDVTAPVYGSNVTSHAQVQVLEPEGSAAAAGASSGFVSRVRGLFRRKMADAEAPAAQSDTHLQTPDAGGHLEPVYSVTADGTCFYSVPIFWCFVAFLVQNHLWFGPKR